MGGGSGGGGFPAGPRQRDFVQAWQFATRLYKMKQVYRNIDILLSTSEIEGPQELQESKYRFRHECKMSIFR